MKKKVLIRLGILGLVLGIVLTAGIQLQIAQRSSQQKVAGVVITPTASVAISTPTKTDRSLRLHVRGTQLLDASGHPVLLRGAQIESPFAYIQAWQRGEAMSKNLNPSIFNTMVHDWKMNVVRLPISNWIYALDPAIFLSQLD